VYLVVTICSIGLIDYALVQILKYFLKGIRNTLVLIGNGLRSVGHTIGSVIFPIIFLLYKLLYISRGRGRKVFTPAKNYVVYLLSKKELIAVVFLGIAMFTGIEEHNVTHATGELLHRNNRFESHIYEANYFSSVYFEETYTKPPPSPEFAYNRDVLSIADTGSRAGANQTDTLLRGGDALAATSVEASASTAEREEVIMYTVRTGDTPDSIAKAFGLKTDTILWANNLSEKVYIKPGETLVIPPVNGMLVKVNKGDHIETLVEKYRGDLDFTELLQDTRTFNKLTSLDALIEGEYLMIPGGVKPAPVKRYYAGSGLVGSDPWGNPTGEEYNLGSGFLGWPISVWKLSRGYSAGHHAMDFDGRTGDPILAAEGGVIIRAQTGYNYGLGCNIAIDHGGGVITVYAHLHQMYYSAGSRVERGEVIAEMGGEPGDTQCNPGISTGDHLHFELHINGNTVNPAPYF
jgi:murein DD-endopeptidase MepM/ murein hydrolase activator NlpD